MEELKGLTIFGFIRRHWYLVVLLLFILPPIINSISIAIETQNPSYPLFDLAERLFMADAVIQKDVNTLIENPSLLVGMEKPETGIWKNVVYNWKYFWNVIWRMIGNVWLIFFPFLIIYKLSKLINNSSPAKNMIYSALIFLGFLIIVNSVILVNGVISGNEFMQIPEGLDTFGRYFYVLKQILPFHGVFSLIKYLVL
jgi:hypothetical protein